MKADPSTPIHVIKGADEILLAEASSELVHRLLDGSERAEHVDEFSGDDYPLGAVVAAACTVSMFGDRLVLARNCGRFTTDELSVMMAYLAEPVEGSTVVMIWDRPVASGARSHPVPKKFSEAVVAAGGEIADADYDKEYYNVSVALVVIWCAVVCLCEAHRFCRWYSAPSPSGGQQEMVTYGQHNKA
jgi:hypothetical protein